MSSELQLAYGVTGRTLYAVIRNSSGDVGLVGFPSFESYDEGDWTSYAYPMTEDGTSGYYRRSFPSDFSPGIYLIEIRQQVGGTPVVSDPLVGAGDLSWDGENSVGAGDVSVSGELQTLDDLFASIQALFVSSGVRVRAISPLSPTGRELEIYSGDAYDDDNGNAISFGFTGAPNITGKTCTLGIGKHDAESLIKAAGTIVVSGSTGTQTVKFQLTQAQTLLLDPDESYEFNFAVDYTASTPPKPRTLVAGNVVTRRKWSD